MTKKIFSSIMLTAACVLLASMITIVGFLRDYFGGIEESGLREELGIAAVGVEDDGTDYLAALPDGQRRFTWIAADGSVIYDTKADADSLENHSDREEFKAALATGAGESVRYSNTLMQKTMYAARRLDDGTVLRVSVSTATVGALLLGVTQPMLAVLAAALILSAILAKHISRRVVAPLNELDLEHPLDDSNAAYEELAPVLGRINRQRSQINSQLRELRRRTDEFAQVTGSMREGLVLLNEQGYILSMNPAARNIFAVEGDCTGKDFLTVDRSCDMSAAVRSAMESGHGRLHERHGGRIYQVDVSRIDSDGAAIGTVILVFDVTEQESAEQNVAKQSEKAQQSTDKMMAEPENPVQCEDSPHEQKVTEDKGTGEEANQQEHFEIPEENNGRLQQLFDKIRYTVKKICAKIKNILQNLSFYRELWKDPDTQGLLQHAGKRFGFIIKRLRPRKLQINAVIGTGSPDTTGYLYGIYGMLLSWLGKGINITPDFEQAVLEGDFQTAGHFTIGCVLFHSVRLLLDKRLRQLLDKIKQFKKIQKKAS